LRCPFCANADSKVVDSREQAGNIRRRRECLACHRRFTTHERTVNRALVVVKRDGRREEFDRDKLFEGMQRACHKRPVPTEQIDQLTGEVEGELLQSGQREVTTHDIGEKVMARLRKLDEIAYVRFASVYHHFQDVDTLAEEIADFKEWKQRSEEAKRQWSLGI